MGKGQKGEEVELPVPGNGDLALDRAEACTGLFLSIFFHFMSLPLSGKPSPSQLRGKEYILGPFMLGKTQKRRVDIFPESQLVQSKCSSETMRD